MLYFQYHIPKGLIMRRILLLCILTTLISGGTVFAADHTPVFTWRTLGGVVHAEQWIYDNDMPVARFDNSIIEQPAQMLMFFNRVPRPVILRDIRLTPGGEPLVGCIQLFEKPAGLVITDQLKDLTVEGDGSDRLRVTFVTRDAYDVAESKRVLTLTYDADRETYVYDFQGELTFLSPETLNGKGTNTEFSDPWFNGCPAPALEFQGMWERRYQNFIYEAADGSVVSIPINHYTTSHKGNIRLKPDGMFMTAYEPDANPAIQFVGDTADKCYISICWWGYDYHLNRSITPDELFEPIRTHFRVFNCPSTTARALVDRGVTPPLGDNEWAGWDAYPVYERSCSFDKGLRLDESWDGDIDPFPWTFSGEGAEWDRTSGRTDSNSLKISRDSTGLTRWQTFQGDGAGYFAEPWKPCKGYRVSCWVKTEDIDGRGATVALQYHVPNSQQISAVYTARRISGTRGWTKLEVEIGPPQSDPTEIGCLMVILQQDGAGTSWFDDLEVEPIH
jgi:hypothetical protein